MARLTPDILPKQANAAIMDTGNFATLIMKDCTAVARCLPGRLAYYKAKQGGYLLEYNAPLI